VLKARYLDVQHHCMLVYTTSSYTTTLGINQASIPNVPLIWQISQKGRTTVGWTWWRHPQANNEVCLPKSFLANSVLDHSKKKIKDANVDSGKNSHTAHFRLIFLKRFYTMLNRHRWLWIWSLSEPWNMHWQNQRLFLYLCTGLHGQGMFYRHVECFQACYVSLH